MLSTTAFLALATQCATSVHPSTALDVARVESGFHPYAIAEIVPGGKGVISHFPASHDEAMSLTGRLAAQGRRYSVGLMQITSTNFRHYGVTASDLLNPCINLSVFERILADCYRRGSTLKRALSCYYSGNFETGQRPNPPLTRPATYSALAMSSRPPGKTGSEPLTRAHNRLPVIPPLCCAASLPVPLRRS